MTILPPDALASVFSLYPGAHFAQIEPHLAMAQFVVWAAALHEVVDAALAATDKLSHFALSTEH